MKIIKNRKMKGTVLLTVVSIMTLMIIFMTTTLVLANAANKRAHRSYSASQAEFTARAAIEAFTNSMERDPGIVAAVQNMTATVHPTVRVDDSSGHSLGYVGYYDTSGNFVRDQIEVEKIGSTYVRANLTGAGETWEPVDVVKISATARVGKEEKTVSAYIKKRGSQKSGTGTKVKGLNTAGAAKFPNGKVITGGLGVGLEHFKTGQYEMRNEMTIDTTLSFINGGLEVKTSTFQVNVETDESETIVMGDLTVANNEFVNLKYTPSGPYTPQNTPYLFVYGNIAGSQLNVKNKATGGVANQPYNIFAKSVNLSESPYQINSIADFYLYDETASSKIGDDSAGGSNLYSWAAALMNGSIQHHPHGGSIYSMGNVTIGGITINGDVRVAKNLTIDNPSNMVTVNGNIVCGGNLNFTNSAADKFTITGSIYCDHVTGQPSGVTVQPLSNYTQDVYPEDMKLDKILGTVNPVSGEVTAASSATKIIKTLDEVREGLGYDKSNGGFDTYQGAVSDFGTDAENQTHYNSPSDYITNASGTISDSCTITGFAGNVTIDASSKEIMVVLKGTSDVTVWNGPTPEVVHNAINLGGNTITVTGNKGVKFFIDGNLMVDNGKIIYDAVYNQTDINYQTKIPIDYYGARTTLNATTGAEEVNSSIRTSNNCLLMGSFKMPWTDFDCKNQGPKAFNYTSDTGVTYSGQPSILGNALFRDLIDTQNEFQMFYTEAGSSSGGGGITTALGYYDLDYFSGS